MEFVSIDSPRRREGSSDLAKVTPGVDTSVPRDLTIKDVRRVIAFVVDDVTIPSEDMVRVRQMLSDFVDNKMQDGDLVAVVRTVGGKGLLEQFTAGSPNSTPSHLATECAFDSSLSRHHRRRRGAHFAAKPTL